MDLDLETIDERHSILKDWRYYLPRLDSVLEPPPAIATNWYSVQQDEEERAVRSFVEIARLALRALSSDDNDPQVAIELKKHIQIWRRETEHTSIVSQMVAHPSYLSLIKLGGQHYRQTVRALLKELQARPTFWFTALEAITDQNFSNSNGDFDRERRAWLKWGKENNFL